MAGEDPARVAWVKTLRCLCRAPGETCSAVVEAHHAGRRGMARKAHDDTTVPLCSAHHAAFHANTGPFKRWTKAQLRAWAAAAIAATQAGWAQQQKQVVPDWA
jgi:hypothetical protein